MEAQPTSLPGDELTRMGVTGHRVIELTEAGVRHTLGVDGRASAYALDATSGGRGADFAPTGNSGIIPNETRQTLTGAPLPGPWPTRPGWAGAHEPECSPGGLRAS